MSDLGLIARNTSEVALSAATAKTIVQIVAPTNQRLKIKSWGVFFDGTSATAEPVVCELMRQTDAGTMSALTLVKDDPSFTETIQSTAQENATGEPTGSTVLERRNVHPQASYEKIYPFGQEKKVPGGGRLAIRCTAPAGVNVIGEIAFEE